MIFYAPAYYKNFTCIADKCTHSCCIGWEIDIDKDTLSTYRLMEEDYGEVIRNSIDTSGETPCFRLGEGDRCPHLNGLGLCNIISNVGETFLCNICREHPRFYNDTPYGKEVGLGLACEEACRIVLSSPNYADMVELGEVEGDITPLAFDALPHRQKTYAILQDGTLSYRQKLHTLTMSFDISPICEDDNLWRDILANLEYLNEAHSPLFQAYAYGTTPPSNLEQPLLSALAYFIYRHGTSAYDLEDFRTSVGFGLFCVHLITSVMASQGVQDFDGLCEIARIVSEELEYCVENTEAIQPEFLFS